MRELKVAFRRLRQQLWFAAAAIVTLALGIAAPTTLFALVDATLLKPLPYPRYQDIYTVRTTMSDGRFTIGLVASEEMSALRKATDGIAASAYTQRFDGTILRDASPRQVTTFGVSEGFFELFGLPMAAGRTFAVEDYAAAFGSRVILSHRLWRSMFSGDPQIVGRTIQLGGRSAFVVGIAPASFDVPRDAALWFAQHTPDSVGHSFDGYVRFKPGVTPAAIQGPMPAMWDALARKYPNFEKNRIFTMRPLLETIVGDLGPILVMAFAATALLLILAMVNVANLLVARNTAQRRAIAVRAALGATRFDLLRPLLAESSLIAIAATAAGLAMTAAAVRTIVLIGGASLPRVEGMRLDPRVFLFSALVMVIAGLVIGLAPASTLGAVNLSELANEGGRGGQHGRSTRRMLGAMVVAEVTLAIALVSGAGRLLLSMNHLLAIDPGFASEGRLAIDVVLPRAYSDPERAAVWAQQADERLRALGANAVAAASSLPLRQERDSTVLIDITNRPTDPAKQPNGRLRTVSPGFFDVAGIKIVAGRRFTVDDRRGGAPVVMINRAWARTFMPDLDPLRERIDPTVFATRVDGKIVRHDAAIVGIVEDVAYADLTKVAEPIVYVSDTQVSMLRRSLVITTPDGRPGRLAQEIRAEFAKLDSEVPVEFELWSDAVSSSLMWPKLGLLLMATFGGAALVLAATGVFGVIAFVAAQRSGEMAVRLALGAPRGHVFRLVMLHGGALASLGLVAGVVLAWWTGQLMGKYVYQVSAASALVLGGSAALVLAVAVAATLPSARRAALIAPADALKS